MPLYHGINLLGKYYVWEKTGKKYYYKTPLQKKIAIKKALNQGRAIFYNKIK